MYGRARNSQQLMANPNYILEIVGKNKAGLPNENK